MLSARISGNCVFLARLGTVVINKTGENSIQNHGLVPYKIRFVVISAIGPQCTKVMNFQDVGIEESSNE